MLVVNRNEKWLTFSICFYMLFVFLPVTRILPTAMKAMMIGLSILFFIFHDFRDTRRLAKDFIFMILVVLMDLLIYFGIWESSGVDILSKNLMLFVFWIPLLLMCNLKTYSVKSKRQINKLALTLIIIECITTIIGNIRYPYASRQLASIMDIDLNRFYQSMNIGGYGFIYALVLLIPYCFYRLKKGHERQFLLYILLIEATIILSSYMTAIIFSIMVLLLCIVLNSKIRKQITGIVFVSVFSFVLFRTQIGLIFNELYLHLLSNDQHILAERVRNISIFLSSGVMTGDAGYRNELFYNSWDAFIKSPIVGNLLGDANILGLHSEFIDWLGGVGILGVSFIILVLSGRIRIWLKQIKHGSFFPYSVITMLSLFTLGLMNTITATPELAAVTFLIITLVPEFRKKEAM